MHLQPVANGSFDALIMAGGRSGRMRRSNAASHKALVPVLGVPLIERNLRQLIASGMQRVAIAVSADEPDLLDYVANAAPTIAQSLGGSCGIVVEQTPLGTIGATREVEFGDALLVVNVDNLTTLSYPSLLHYHRAHEADLTIAAHREEIALDFGELILDGAAVIEYREKPIRRPIVSSGIYVVSHRAADCVRFRERLGIPELFERLKSRGARIVAFEHGGFWIDVNDRDAVERAERALLKLEGIRR